LNKAALHKILLDPRVENKKVSEFWGLIGKY
jgi:hypothetical protein